MFNFSEQNTENMPKSSKTPPLGLVAKSLGTQANPAGMKAKFQLISKSDHISVSSKGKRRTEGLQTRMGHYKKPRPKSKRHLFLGYGESDDEVTSLPRTPTRRIISKRDRKPKS